VAATSLVTQTTYAELLERCAAIAFSDAFPEDGTFVPKTVRGRRYWYFQARDRDGRQQRYVGPESPQLLQRIENHKQARSDERERRQMVSALVRSLGLPSPLPQIGEVVGALARAGIFRLRGVLVGTVAYQTYSAMLGAKLPGSLLQTTDVDIAQFTNVSIAVGDHTPPMIDVLKGVDTAFRKVPHTSSRGSQTSYAAKNGLRVDFVTPNEGPETDEPQDLPAFRTAAQPLRFLDFLIHAPVQAVLLHGSGILVNVPIPERYAVHKLIIALRRPAGILKRDKDIYQAQALLEVLMEKRPDELKQAWEEAYERGASWRDLLLRGMTLLATEVRDRTLKLLGRTRDILPGIDLTFDNPHARYDSRRDVVVFAGESLGGSLECAVSREALEDHFGSTDLNNSARVATFLRNRSRIESLLRTKYLTWAVEETGSVLLKSLDVEELTLSADAK
jgi:hypothetical protein